MRARAPALYHEHMGRFEGAGDGDGDGDDEGGAPLRLSADDTLASGLLKAHDEAQRRAQLRHELAEAAAQASEQEESESESEREEEGEGEEQQQQSGVDAAGAAAAAAPVCDRVSAAAQDEDGLASAVAACASTGSPGARRQTAEERRQLAFRTDMQQRFLLGQEAGVDYSAIDADAHLDEHWAREAAQDAEDAYFDDV